MTNDQSSSILINSTDPNGVVITLSPLGFRGAAKTAICLGGGLLFFVTCFLSSILWMHFSEFGGVDHFLTAVLILGGLKLVGLTVLLTGIHLAKKKSLMIADSNTLTITQHGPLWKSQKQWRTSDIESIDKEDVYDSESRSHTFRLLIRIKGKWLGVSLFHERSENEIETLVATLRQALQLNP